MIVGRRRDFSSTILLIGLLLIFFVSYHAWYKPQDTPPPVHEDTVEQGFDLTPNNTSALPPPTTAPEPPLFEPDDPEVSAIHVAKAEAPPASNHGKILAAILTLIEQKKDIDAEERLRALPEEAASNSELTQYVAILWNNLGVLQKETRGPAFSIASYQAGLALDPQSPTLNLNLAHAYWETRDPDLTRQYLENLVRLVPHRPFPHLALADLLYREHDLAGAVQHLELATSLSQKNPPLASYLQVATAKVRAAQLTENTFLVRESSHFVVKFDGEEDYAIWHEVLSILEDAYRDIGQKLGYFPSQPIHVVLVSRQQFHSAMGTPVWADALFDPVLGRIKIPTQGALTDKAWLTRVLRHEYVHALIHERMGLAAGAVPTWLNEGLAMQLAGDTWPEIDQIPSSGDLRLIPLPALAGSWGHLSPEAATLAYLQANSATRYMITRYSLARVGKILSSLKSGNTMSQAVEDILMVSYDTFQRRWKNNLKMAAKRSRNAQQPSFN